MIDGKQQVGVVKEVVIQAGWITRLGVELNGKAHYAEVESGFVDGLGLRGVGGLFGLQVEVQGDGGSLRAVRIGGRRE